MRILMGVILVFAVHTLALAECILDGRRVPNGTRVGNLECRNGQWVQVGQFLPEEGTEKKFYLTANELKSSSISLIGSKKGHASGQICHQVINASWRVQVIPEGPQQCG